jgi:hypothetical protein
MSEDARELHRVPEPKTRKEWLEEVRQTLKSYESKKNDDA